MVVWMRNSVRKAWQFSSKSIITITFFGKIACLPSQNESTLYAYEYDDEMEMVEISNKYGYLSILMKTCILTLMRMCV